MRVDAFDFDLPREAIATRPARPRDSARLLDLTAGLAHRGVADLPALLQPGDMMVFNDTRVIPARLVGVRGEARVELTLHRRVGDNRWLAFAKPSRRLRPGDAVRFAEGFSANVEARDGPEVRLVFDRGGAALAEALQRHGAMPLPPYIRRAADVRDRDDYQTVFARCRRAPSPRRPPACISPTACCRPSTRAASQRRFVTLHVGAGTFLPVSVEDTADHPMHSEACVLTPDAAAAINRCRAAGGRIVAVGTTSRETARERGPIRRDRPGVYRRCRSLHRAGLSLQVVDLMLTNFHLPRSTLFMLVCAFAGTERMKAAYAEALKAGYRFYSYGDACLLASEEDAA